MNNQTLFQIVQSAGGMHLLYNNDIEQVRAIAEAAFEAGKQAAGVQDVLDMTDSRNWQVGDVVQLISQQYAGFGVGQYGTVHAVEDAGVRIEMRRQCDAMPMVLPMRHECASIDFKWIRHTTKETAK